LIAWALYHLLKPVHAALALLAAWFQLVYTAAGLSASLHLVSALRLANARDELAQFGAGPVHAQLQWLLESFRSEWGLSLLFFGIHLLLVGYLVFRSSYIPKWVGVLLAVAGAAYIVQNVNLYLFPQVDLGVVAIGLIGELVFMVWLLIRGWKIKEPETAASS
jgi:hypothetical protein